MLASLKVRTPIGDKVRLDIPSMGTIKLAKSDGLWRIDPSLLKPDGTEWSNRLHDHYLPLYLKLASDIEAGGYKSEADLRTAIDDLHRQMAADHQRTLTTAPSH